MEPRTFSLRYRPQTFQELFDQEHIKRTLINAIERNRLVHAYLFAGPRGVGKTTTARILAKSLNCEQGPTPIPCNKCSSCLDIKASNSLDVLEIDGASTRGIEHIRELRDSIRYRPTSGRYRIYIIDEVHMLTDAAFNALLKTLEEPPGHVIFIFATTEPLKVPPTILSRCQRFDFKRIPLDIIAERLQMIIKKEKLDVETDAVKLITNIADGSLRDAESVLEQIITFKQGNVTAFDITELLGIVPEDRFCNFLALIGEGKEQELLEFLEGVFREGYDSAEFYFGFIGYLRALLFTSLGMKAETFSFSESVLSHAEGYGPKKLAEILKVFLKSEEAFKRSHQKVIFIETLALSLLDMLSEPVSLKKTPTPVDVPSSSPVKRIKPEPTSTEDEINPSAHSAVDEPPTSLNKSTRPDEQIEKQEITTYSTLSVSEIWSQFLTHITKEQSFVSFALKDSIVAEDKEDNLMILLPGNAQHQITLLEENRAELERRLTAFAGKCLKLEFKLSAKEKNSHNKMKSGSTVEDVLDIFKGEIVR
ncbi:DNA polymerase III subunit gamma/tau [candidate division WOR-3 bacterium]|nr:DNA polymerase III subunit gamma/tau [candidate division WOR-3 bacterium]